MFLSTLEKRMLDEGLGGFSPFEMNALIQRVAEKYGKIYYEVDPEMILQHHKNIKIDIFNEKCEEIIIEGFTASNGHVYRTNRDDQINMMGQKDAIKEDPSMLTVSWKTEDSGYTDHTVEEFLQVYKEAFYHKASTLYKYRDLKKRIEAATSHEEIVAITW